MSQWAVPEKLPETLRSLAAVCDYCVPASEHSSHPEWWLCNFHQGWWHGWLTAGGKITPVGTQ